MQKLNEFEELLIKLLKEAIPYLNDHMDDPHVIALLHVIHEAVYVALPEEIPEPGLCSCKIEYSIEPHGPDGHFVLYKGRCMHRHGLNLCRLSEFDYNGELTRAQIVRALNL